MPYHRRRRRGCKACAHRSRDGCRASSRSPPGPLIRRQAWPPPSDPVGTGAHSAPAALAARGPTFGVEYLVRQARITDIDRLGRHRPRVDARGPAADRSMPRTCCASSSTCRTRACSSPKCDASSRAARCSSSVRRLSPAATWARSTSWSSRPDHDADRVTECAPGGAPPLREQQGLLDGRGRRALRSRGPRPPRARRVRPRRANAPAARRGGRCRPPAEPSAPGGREGPDRPNHHRSHCGQERRRLRGRGEHLLRGQGGRRGYRLRHAAEVGHRRTRFRPRVCLYRARPGQREPAQLPPVPRAATSTRSSARTSASTATARSRRTSTSSSSST